MSKPKSELPLFGLMALVLFLFPYAFLARGENKACDSSSLCGNLTITYPFRLKSQPKCNDTDYRVELECENDNRTIWVTDIGILYVREIFYSNFTIRLVNPSLDGDNCSRPRSTLPYYDSPCEEFKFYFYPLYPYDIVNMYLENCTRPIKSSLYVDASRCSSSHPSSYFYFLDQETPTHDFSQFCTTIAVGIPVMIQNITGLSTSDIYEKLLMGIDLSWQYYSCSDYKEPSVFHTM